MKNELILNENEIESKIFTIRGLQVMLDRDLAELYEVETKRLNEQVKRNKGRFPESFSFQLIESEVEIINSQSKTSINECSRSQIATLNKPHQKRGKNIKYLPYVFTEQGIAMLSAVLRSETAIQVSVQIINAFISMRRFIFNNAQYKNFEIRKFEKSHDRFLIIDNTEIYHLGASLKDLGKKWFAFSKLGSDFVEKVLWKLR